MPQQAATGRPRKYCRDECKDQAKRGRVPRPIADVVPITAATGTSTTDGTKYSAPRNTDGTRRDYLTYLRNRLYSVFDNCPADKVAALSKEFRELLREIEAIDNNEEGIEGNSNDVADLTFSGIAV
ncbi:MAG: hypothetical protein LBH13_06540 [Cellulomonadaceae bacterium]|jgi:hypothetical protein|nr:hypothetical protein [Cellulomonadaceae bacterium]